MRKLIVILVVIGALIGIFFLTRGDDQVVQTPSTLSSSTKPDASNATFEFDDGLIKLTSGKSEQQITPDSELKEEITLSDIVAYGDLNNDKKNDAGVVIIRSGGGSGVFVYVAAFVSGLVNYKGSNAIFIGDRVSPKSIEIKGGVLTLVYLDRGPEEALAAEPTMEVTKQFSFAEGKLIEK